MNELNQDDRRTQLNAVPICEAQSSVPAMSRRDMLALLGVMGLASATDAVAQDAAAINPRAYKVLLENDRVRVLEYLSRPGFGVCGNGKHSHPDHLTVVVTDAKVKITTSEGKVITAENKPGDVFWEPASTHEVENLTGRLVRSYIIELKGKAWKAST